MKFHKLFISVVAVYLLFPLFAKGQEGRRYTLDRCIGAAIEHAPEYKLYEMNRQVTGDKIKNLSVNYYPSLDINGQASWQSDVTKVPIPPVPGFSIEELDKDWYKINLNVSQTIWDGGFTKKSKQLEKEEEQIKNGETDVQLYRLKEKVFGLFFTALVYNENAKVLETSLESIDKQLEEMRAAVENGVLLQADLNSLEVEKLRLRQKITALAENGKGAVAALNEITGLKIESAEELDPGKPALPDLQFVNLRPDFKVMTLRQQKLLTLQSLSASKRMPRFNAFGQAGYGRPGYDMLNNKFDTYYMVGLRLYWNVWDWNKVKREKALFNLQREMLEINKEALNRSLRSQLEQQKAEIRKYEKLIAGDEKIVALQQKVVDKTASQMKEGTVTATAYLVELNKLLKIKLEQKTHRLQLIFAEKKYDSLMGRL